MSTLPEFLKRADAFAKAAGLKRSTVSLYLFNDGKSLDRLHDGGDIGARQMALVIAKLAELEAGLPARRERLKESAAAARAAGGPKRRAK